MGQIKNIKLHIVTDIKDSHTEYSLPHTKNTTNKNKYNILKKYGSCRLWV